MTLVNDYFVGGGVVAAAVADDDDYYDYECDDWDDPLY